MSEPSTLFVVRRMTHGKSGGSKPPNTDGRMIGVFGTRQRAEARLAEAEKEAARSGNFWPIYDEQNLEALMAWSDFDPGVFRDWMSDHDIPDPASVPPNTGPLYECPWYAWLNGLGKERLAKLYEAMHRFRFCEIREIPCVEGPDPDAIYSYPPLGEDDPY